MLQSIEITVSLYMVIKNLTNAFMEVESVVL